MKSSENGREPASIREKKKDRRQSCELCGRPFPLHALDWQHGRLLCPACLQEMHSCGCEDG